MTPSMAAITIPRGWNIATKRGPILCRHHEITPTWNAEPKTPWKEENYINLGRNKLSWALNSCTG